MATCEEIYCISESCSSEESSDTSICEPKIKCHTNDENGCVDQWQICVDPTKVDVVGIEIAKPCSKCGYEQPVCYTPFTRSCTTRKRSKIKSKVNWNDLNKPCRKCGHVVLECSSSSPSSCTSSCESTETICCEVPKKPPKCPKQRKVYKIVRRKKPKPPTCIKALKCRDVKVQKDLTYDDVKENFVKRRLKFMTCKVRTLLDDINCVAANSSSSSCECDDDNKKETCCCATSTNDLEEYVCCRRQKPTCSSQGTIDNKTYKTVYETERKTVSSKCKRPPPKRCEVDDECRSNPSICSVQSTEEIIYYVPKITKNVSFKTSTSSINSDRCCAPRKTKKYKRC